jgi:hypothetical protein
MIQKVDQTNKCIVEYVVLKENLEKLKIVVKKM